MVWRFSIAFSQSEKHVGIQMLKQHHGRSLCSSSSATVLVILYSSNSSIASRTNSVESDIHSTRSLKCKFGAWKQNMGLASADSNF